MRLQTDIVVQLNPVADYRVWTNKAAFPDPGPGTDNGGRVNVIRLCGDWHRKIGEKEKREMGKWE
jgi:hypothetical protein